MMVSAGLTDDAAPGLDKGDQLLDAVGGDAAHFRLIGLEEAPLVAGPAQHFLPGLLLDPLLDGLVGRLHVGRDQRLEHRILEGLELADGERFKLLAGLVVVQFGPVIGRIFDQLVPGGRSREQRMLPDRTATTRAGCDRPTPRLGRDPLRGF